MAQVAQTGCPLLTQVVELLDSVGIAAVDGRVIAVAHPGPATR